MIEGFCGLLRSIDVAKAKSILEGSVCCFTLVDWKVLVVCFLALTSFVSFVCFLGVIVDGDFPIHLRVCERGTP